VEELYFKYEAGAYKGALMDGHYWDTILVANNLIESGIPKERMEKAAEYIASSQQHNGGFPYGKDFEYAPDLDDTAEALLLLSHWKEKYGPQINKSLEWIKSKQNSNGGWAAFEKDIEGNYLLRKLTKKYQDSVDLFDSSCADVTGHMLEALGSLNLTARNCEAVAKAVQYLKNTQDSARGIWFGRWGISYLYGTSAAIAGLLKAGEHPQDPYIKKALHWMMSKQNPDGGFGETTESYQNPRLAGIGVSTPSHTSWVLIALVSAGLASSSCAKRAAQYLQKEFRRNGKWIDSSVVGTGHPGLLYMNYPAYPYVFPLLAISMYVAAVKKEKGSLTRYTPRLPKKAYLYANVHALRN
jgi:squalene-hopene/tetraprenyl-beta-curcumene cyclase